MVKRARRSERCTAFALAALLLPALAAAAEEVVLRPRYEVGDRYALTLATDTMTRVDARGAAQKAFRENVELRYRAQVEVIETDAAGMPVRERHEGVDLTSVRPEGTKSLFTEGAAFDLARRSDGSVEITFRGERVATRIERIVGELLAHQSEYALAALLDPGRPVSVGERWELDPERVRDFLRARGIRSAAVEGAATAELRTGEGDRLALRYEIPIRRFELPDLPEGAERRSSEGSLKGELELDGQGLHRTQVHSSALALEIDGSLSAPTGRAASWTLKRSQSVDQRTEMLEDQLATGK